ncbi:MAG: hypothetical protein ACSLFO_13995 [Acidimicrobiales bacterium]
MDPIPGAPSDNTTLVGELALFREQGFDGDFYVEDGPVLRCGACDHRIAGDDVDLVELRRLEGASDPADMMAILALECMECGGKGTAVVAYGPTATQAEDEILRRLDEPNR